MMQDVERGASLADALRIIHDGGFERGWNAAIEAAVEAALSVYCDGDWLDRDHAANTCAQAIRQLKKPTGNLAPTTTDSV